MIESQAFVMTNLRNGIDYLKATCKNAGNVESLLFLAVLKVLYETFYYWIQNLKV